MSYSAFATALLFSTISVLSIPSTGCAAETDDSSIETSESELSGVRFYERTPFDGRALEALRTRFTTLESARWTRNGGDIVSLHWEGHLAAATRSRLIQDAFSWHMHPEPGSARRKAFFSNLKELAPSTANVRASLDFVGYSSSSADSRTVSERGELEVRLAAVLSYSNTHLLTGELNYDPGVEWENGLIVVDDKNQDILIVQGSWGN